jgi:uncharacterized protein
MVRLSYHGYEDFNEGAGRSAEPDSAPTWPSTRRPSRCPSGGGTHRPSSQTQAPAESANRYRSDHGYARPERRPRCSRSDQRASGGTPEGLPVTYLLDVNALLALGVQSHVFHSRVATWLRNLSLANGHEMTTCSITELGFIRVLSQVPAYGYSVPDARLLLNRVKARSIVEFRFVADDQDLSELPRWVTSPKHLTDGHLIQLASANDGVLATLDRGIPGALLIPG